MGLLGTLKKRGIKCSLYKIASRLTPKDKEVMSACDRIGAYRYMRRYESILDNPIENINDVPQSEKPIIWLCWLQGYDNAPVIVQRCRESVYKNTADYQVIELCQENIDQYVEVPDYINIKHNEGIIPHAHYTDYVRTLLLTKYGGVWIDSTIFLTGGLPDYINGHELFCYQYSNVGKMCMGCCLLSSPANNIIMIQMKRLLEEYWRHENRLVSYSIYHLFWTMVVSHNDKTRTEWAKVPKVYGSNIVLLWEGLFTPFSERRFNQIKSLTTIHKLSYKYPKENEKLKDTFFQRIIDGQI